MERRDDQANDGRQRRADDLRYIVRLVGQVASVSVETTRLARAPTA